MLEILSLPPEFKLSPIAFHIGSTLTQTATLLHLRKSFYFYATPLRLQYFAGLGVSHLYITPENLSHVKDLLYSLAEADRKIKLAYAIPSWEIREDPEFFTSNCSDPRGW